MKTILTSFVLSFILFLSIQPLFSQGFQRNEMLNAINRIRSQSRFCGNEFQPKVGSIRWNPKLELIANHHSVDMHRYGFFDHRGSDGKRIGHRAEKMNYDFKEIGENIAVGYKTINGVLLGWLGSPEHCKCIMNPLYKEVAVSRVGNYWTQVFGITHQEAWSIYKQKREQYFAKQENNHVEINN